MDKTSTKHHRILGEIFQPGWMLSFGTQCSLSFGFACAENSLQRMDWSEGERDATVDSLFSLRMSANLCRRVTEWITCRKRRTFRHRLAVCTVVLCHLIRTRVSKSLCGSLPGVSGPRQPPLPPKIGCGVTRTVTPEQPSGTRGNSPELVVSRRHAQCVSLLLGRRSRIPSCVR